MSLKRNVLVAHRRASGKPPAKLARIEEEENEDDDVQDMEVSSSTPNTDQNKNSGGSGAGGSDEPFPRPTELPQQVSNKNTIYFDLFAKTRLVLEPGKIYAEPLSFSWLYLIQNIFNRAVTYGPIKNFQNWFNNLPDMCKQNFRFVGDAHVNVPNITFLADNLDSLGGTPISTTAFSPTVWLECARVKVLEANNQYFHLSMEPGDTQTSLAFDMHISNGHNTDTLGGISSPAVTLFEGLRGDNRERYTNPEPFHSLYVRQASNSSNEEVPNIIENGRQNSYGYYALTNVFTGFGGDVETAEKLYECAEITKHGESSSWSWTFPLPQNRFNGQLMIDPTIQDNEGVVHSAIPLYATYRTPLLTRSTFFRNLSGFNSDSRQYITMPYDALQHNPGTIFYAFPPLQDSAGEPMKFRCIMDRTVSFSCAMDMHTGMHPSQLNLGDNGEWVKHPMHKTDAYENQTGPGSVFLVNTFRRACVGKKNMKFVGTKS